MPQSKSSVETVARLKELLFDRESRELDTLATRIAALQERAGSDEQLQRSVARVIDGAIRDAETTHHRELADAMSPMVLRTLRTEMKSPDMQDQITGLMYPRMGELVRRYVASAVRDMMQEINRRLESSLSQNRLALWVRSRTSGRSMAELALADTQRLEIDEIYLVRRGSGELIHHWQRHDAASPDATPESAPTPGRGGNRDTLVSGFLTAISAFSEEAFEADRESLRTLDLDDHRIYLRGAPAHLLAVKCKGSAPAAIEQLFDDELIRVLAEHQQIEQDTREAEGDAGRSLRSAANERILDGLAHRLQDGAAERTREQSRGHGMRTLRTILWIVGIPLLALLAWHSYVSWTTSDLQRRANAAVAAIPALSGYPVKVHVERGAGRMWVTGLVPDDASRRLVLSSLKELAPTVALTPEISVLPRTDVDAKLGAETLRRAIERARPRLATLAGDLATARDKLVDGSDREALTAAETAARNASAALDRIDPTATVGATVGILLPPLAALKSAADRLAQLAGADAVAAVPPPADPAEAAEALALVADRITSLVAGIEQRRNVAPLAQRLDAVRDGLAERTADLDRRLAERIAELERRLAALAPRPPSPHERLAGFVRTNAVFFANDTDYRDGVAARQALDGLAPLITAAGEAVRVVGYTDETGGPNRNSPLSQARADKIVGELVSRGVKPELLVGVGRTTGVSIAPGTGPATGNRRVEFELAFRGERGAAP